MILKNALPRIEEAIEEVNKTGVEKDVTFMYHELMTYDTVISLFEWLFKKSIPFKSSYTEHRYVITILPKTNQK